MAIFLNFKDAKHFSVGAYVFLNMSVGQAATYIFIFIEKGYLQGVRVTGLKEPNENS